MVECGVFGCEQGHMARGYCNTHYQLYIRSVNTRKSTIPGYFLYIVISCPVDGDIGKPLFSVGAEFGKNDFEDSMGVWPEGMVVERKQLRYEIRRDGRGSELWRI